MAVRAGVGGGSRRAADGGRVAAHGFRYQYLCTLEAAFDRIGDSAVAAFRVEGPPQGLGADSVDFDVIDHAGLCLLSAQVKSKYTPGDTISASAVFSVLLKLVTECDAEAYLVHCGALPGPGAEELASCLAQGVSGEELRRTLQRILRSEHAGIEKLGASPGLLARLARARVRFDARVQEQISHELKQRLRSHRNRAAQGLGEGSAGLLVESLVGEVLRRATKAAYAEVSMDEFRSLVLVDGRQLARARGVRDWGVLVGFVPAAPDVERSEPLDRLDACLPHPAPAGVRRVVLTGLSGIGKSSLAAAYIAERADLYDLVVWVSGQSEATVRTSFELAGAALNVADAANLSGLDAQILRGLVHAGLGRLPGRWAMVFDDVADLQRIESWLPRHGDGDVLLTTINSTPHPTFGTALAVPAMWRTEAINLLARRFSCTVDITPERQAALGLLADALECWPLALELAAGYILSCDKPLEHVEQYVDDVKTRALDDESSVPAGYPRTLAAALWMSRDALVGRAQSLRDPRPGFALGMLYAAAYLAPRQIPVDLLGAGILLNERAASAAGEGAEGHNGPLIVDPALLRPAETVRELRRHSLVTPDEPYPQQPAGPQASGLTIRINSVIQELLRQDAESNPDTLADPLGNLASHADRWFFAAQEGGDLQRASLLFPHVDALARHVMRVGLGGGRIGTLLGNTGVAHLLRGDIQSAELLMNYQLRLLSADPKTTPFVLAQASLALATCHLHFPDRSSLSPAEAAEMMTFVLEETRNLVEEAPQAAAMLAAQAASALRYQQYRDRANAETTAALYTSFTRILDALAHTTMGQIDASLHTVERLLATGKPEDAAGAERECRSLIKREILNSYLTVEVHRLLIESLVIQERWSQAREAFAAFRQTFSVGLLPMEVVANLIHNIGARWAPYLTMTTSVEATELMDDILAWPHAAQAAAHTEPWSAARLRMIEALYQVSNGDPRTAHSILASLAPSDLDGGTPQETEGWRLRLELAQKTCRAVLAVRPNGAPTHVAPDRAGDPWFDPAFRRQRQTNLVFARIPNLTDPDSAVSLILPSLAAYLEYGVDQVPTVDLALTLHYAFAHLGIAAHPRTASVKIVDHETGRTGKLGTASPRWRSDGTFTGHCVLELPESARVIAPTIELNPLVRAQKDGPAIIRQLTLWSSGQITQGPYGSARETSKPTVTRGTVAITVHLNDHPDPAVLSTDSPYIHEHTAAYETAGRNLASAAINLLRDPQWIDSMRSTENKRLKHLLQALQNATATVDDDGEWSFHTPDAVPGTGARSIDEL